MTEKKLPRLSKTEKDKIESLYKCRRSVMEQDIHDELEARRDEVTRPLYDKIDNHKGQIARLEEIIEERTREEGLGKVDRYGCTRSHPLIDTFKSETSKQLRKLWSGEVNSLEGL